MDKLLIANRGEIARRIIRTCRDLGIATVAVYSEADARAVHVEEADEARLIGKPRAQESYLLADRIIEVAQEAGATLIHPGYGFLSESPDFARKVGGAGLAWVGPTPETIETMGDKARARETARQAGVPVVPGSTPIAAGIVLPNDMVSRTIGFPLLVKAAAGGGGIGMRRVETYEQLADAISATQSMAAKAFGDGTVYLEHFIPKARHVEIQVFGDGKGRAVHLFERDCSLQRRFQKVIEESPAHGLPADVIARMAKTAVTLCEATQYAGAGTVEYIVDVATNEFFFLEMNTRIQVEHPVTEMITSVDLVAWQIELARGRLPELDQSGITRAGASIECRLYAENPARKFFPSPGPLTTFRFPPENADLRIDAGYREGDVVTPFYDPLVAKVIACGTSREAARSQMLVALNAIEIDGIRSNRDFLIACIMHPDFISGSITTDFIDNRMDALVGIK